MNKVNYEASIFNERNKLLKENKLLKAKLQAITDILGDCYKPKETEKKEARLSTLDLMAQHYASMNIPLPANLKEELSMLQK